MPPLRCCSLAAFKVTRAFLVYKNLSGVFFSFFVLKGIECTISIFFKHFVFHSFL